MPNLKHFRTRISSVKSTRKITSAMKMVAASKLRQSQDQQALGKPYSEAMDDVISRILIEIKKNELLHLFPIISEEQDSDGHLLIVITSDRGLCGGFNGNLVREAKKQIHELQSQGKDVQIICIGRKSKVLLKAEFEDIMVGHYEEIAKPTIPFSMADELGKLIMKKHSDGEIGGCSIIYNQFINALVQEPTAKQVVPCVIDIDEEKEGVKIHKHVDGIYSFEPDIVPLFTALLPQYISSSVYRTLLDSTAGEHAARMNAMDNATKNAGEMIDKLTIRYNRARQANITSELIEIISAMEAI